jgi:quercetin dioxygenase-like cupin family protein
MRIALMAVGLVVAPIVVAAAQGPKIVDVTHEPSHHLVLSNDHVRVLNVIVAPRATTLIHRHDHDYLFVTLGDADVTSTKVGDTAVKLVLRDGEVRYAAGGFAHAASNNIDTPFHNVTIELLQSATHEQPCAASCAEPAPCSVARGGACPTVTRVMGADQWTVVSVTLPASGRLDLVDGAGPVLVVAVSGVRLTRGGLVNGDASIRGGPGTLGWVSAAARGAAGARALVNASREPARFVMVQFRSGARE